MPSISIILPVYNGAKYLGDALSSIRAQRIDLGAVEIIATDDGSTDGSERLCRHYKDERIRIVRGEGRLELAADTPAVRLAEIGRALGAAGC